MMKYAYNEEVKVNSEHDESNFEALLCMLLIFGFVMILPLLGINIYETVSNIGIGINHIFSGTVNFISQLSVFLHIDDLVYQFSQLF